jgi:hypothetical protein
VGDWKKRYTKKHREKTKKKEMSGGGKRGEFGCDEGWSSAQLRLRLKSTPKQLTSQRRAQGRGQGLVAPAKQLQQVQEQIDHI